MGISHKSHGQKTDKETQSPVLKIFRDMVQKEKRDPEKTNLLNGKHVEKKRKQFLGYRSKSDQKSLESSSSDVQQPYKQQEQELRSTEYHRSQSQSLPFQGSKSWVFWGEKDNSLTNAKKGRTNDDTCSCVSCALKKLIGNDYACVGCLALLFSISVIIACLLVYKCIPTIANTAPKHDSERLKRKIDSINGWGSFMPKTFGGYNKNKWHDSSFRDLGVVDADSELSRIFDDTKLNEIHSSVRLRDFYKKLLKADSNIRKLKKNSDFSNFDNNLDLNFKTLPEREKRSIHLFKKPLKLFHFRKQKANKTNVEKNKDANLTKIEKSRQKRHGNYSGDTVIIEKDQVLIQYKPRIVPKCSHNIPKDVKAHEHLLKHPFYKNTQRLDELLDKFNRDLPEIINEQFGLQLHVDDEKPQCKHTKPDLGDIKIKMAGYDRNKMADKPKVNNKEKLSVNNYQTDFDMFRKMRNGNPNMEGAKTNGYADFDGDALKRDDMSTNAYDILLTISTLLNSNQKRTTPYPNQMDRIPNLRRLLQTDGEDDETINYEDLKEVLTDDNQEHDDDDKQNRKKRLDDFNPNALNPTKYHPPNVNNPNWKGPMPLYPDEINSMIKQEPVIVNKVGYPVHRDEIKELSDLDYIEDYLDSKYKGLARLAQAYSDYGVLSDKKSAITEKSKMTDKRTKMSPGVSEGIRFEIQPTSTAREDKPINFYDFFQKHVKVTNNLYKKPTYLYPTMTIPTIEYEPKRFQIFENNDVKTPLTQDKRSLKNLDGSNLHKVPLQYDNNPVSINLKNDKIEIENRNKKENRKNKNDLSKHLNNMKIETLNNFNEKVIIENDNNNDKIIFKKRSLKSFDATNNSELEENSEKKIDRRHSRDNKKSKSEVIENISKENVSSNGTNRPDMDLSDFFMMMSNIFSAMDREEVTTKAYNISNTDSNPSTIPDIKTSDILYPMYDSDMVDNIGHRSRVLMSVNGTDGILSESEGLYDAEAQKLTINGTSPILLNNENSIKNKTVRIVKRHADDNTIFWNDIYDDEYGVKMDVFENIKDKNPASNEFMKRSNEWIQDKVKRFSDNFHRTATEDGKNERRVGRSVWNSNNNGNGRNSYYNEKYNRLDRRTRNPEESPQSEGKRTDFSALTVHMKDVCRRAATAVRESNENDDNKGKKTDAATTGMMQELVNLMTNLIDFQVQQRTCMKLPPDLNNFLGWLTDVTPSDNVDDTPNAKLYKSEQPEEIRDEKPSSDMPSERDDQDPRSDCLGTLQAIQDLLRSFEDMPDDDKSKMTGVKDYLLNQITYLKKRLADEEFSNNLQYRMDPYRYKRDLSKRRPRRHRKYVKNYSKKHTKTTASYYDGVTLSEPFEVMTRKKVKEKRNLRDIYYKALADAKKVTTVKNHH